MTDKESLIIMRINDIIKELRTELKLTQEQFAEIMNCNRQKIADWERGKSAPSADDIILLHNKFDVSADYLLGLSPNKTTDEKLKGVCDYTGLSDNAVRIVKSQTDVGNCVRTFMNIMLSANRIDAFYLFCRRLFVHRQNIAKYIEILETFADREVIIPATEVDGEIKPIERSEGFARECLKFINSAKNNMEVSEYGIQKEVIKLMNTFCKREIERQKSADEKYSDELRDLINVAYGKEFADIGVSIVDGGIKYQILDEVGEAHGNNQETQ